MAYYIKESFIFLFAGILRVKAYFEAVCFFIKKPLKMLFCVRWKVAVTAVIAFFVFAANRNFSLYRFLQSLKEFGKIR
jgi:hypothetical protein